jgi:Relaxase/Mobilisation nuclease domain
VIIKGGSRRRGAQLAAHLLRTDQNEKVELREVRGTVATDLLGALDEIEATATGTRCRKPFYHASISPPPDRSLTARQWSHAIDTLERALGLKGQPRVVVAHVKGKRQHVHVVWSRIDLERGRAIADSWNFRIHEEVARGLERDFGHDAVRGAFTGRDVQSSRPKRTPRLHELRQEERSGIRHTDVQAEITALWRSTARGDEFREKLHDAGYILARGDRRTFVVVDAAGGVHALARRIDGVRTRDIQARFSETAVSELPSVTDARAIMRDRLHAIQSECEASEPRQSDSTLPAFTTAKTAVTGRKVSLGKILKLKSPVAAGFYTGKMRLWQVGHPNGSPSAAGQRGETRPPAKPRAFKDASYTRRDQSKDRRISTYAQERAAILLLFGSKIAAAQLYSPKDELAAIITALKSEEKAALNSLREREALEVERWTRRSLLLGWGSAARHVTGRAVSAGKPTTPPRKRGARDRSAKPRR